ncbi:MAG: transglutaminase [Deltaproteobacteria bacterium]|nr:transglutaminase [Deltaproteobacteria bacterium]
MRLIGALLKTLLWVTWIVLVLATPLLGAWLASSLLSYFGGPRELALIGGVLLFPLLPLAWEARATRVFKRRVASRNWYGKPPRRSLSAPVRVVLRTLFLNLLFIAALLFWYPKVAFAALATRGDWFLGERQDELAQRTRSDLFRVASGLEWLHRWANPNPYKKDGDSTPVPDDVVPTEQVPPEPMAQQAAQSGSDAAAPVETGAPDAGSVPTPAPAPALAEPDDGSGEEQTRRVGATSWPRPDTVSATVAAMRARDEGTIEAVARYVAARESDPFERVKALHDWVVTRLRYDHESADGPVRKPQDAEHVFAARTAVCEGYARLLVEMGKFTGDRIAYVVGDVREQNGDLASSGHAWNAVQIDGAWYLLDATWDDPATKDGADNYRTDYLFIPPNVATLDHFPDDERWQLLATPLSRGEFLRQPFARPGHAREGLALLAPERSSVEVGDAVELRLSNPRRLHVLAELVPEHSEQGVECGVDDGAEVRLRCPVPAGGKYEARLFTNRTRYGRYGSVAMIEVTRR